ncbi:MAG: hypothetical protein PHF74_04260 [Dehalococcoidales bacterium]|nr:hypothetical protein [Dehalococcoidales bacterium]
MNTFIESKHKKLLLLGIAILAVIIVMTACNRETEEGTSLSIGDSMLDMGYENCLICHVGGQNPMAVHCDETMQDDASLDICLVCHVDMRNIISGEKPLINCTDCHYPYTDD